MYVESGAQKRKNKSLLLTIFFFFKGPLFEFALYRVKLNYNFSRLRFVTGNKYVRLCDCVLHLFIAKGRTEINKILIISKKFNFGEFYEFIKKIRGDNPIKFYCLYCNGFIVRH